MYAYPSNPSPCHLGEDPDELAEYTDHCVLGVDGVQRHICGGGGVVDAEVDEAVAEVEASVETVLAPIHPSILWTWCG